MLSKIIFLTLLIAQTSFSAVAPYSRINGKVLAFDEKKVKLQVGKESMYVPRSSIADKELKVGMEVQSLSKNETKSKKK